MRKSLRSSKLSGAEMDNVDVDADGCWCVVLELMLPLTVVTDVDDAGDDVTEVTS